MGILFNYISIAFCCCCFSSVVALQTLRSCFLVQMTKGRRSLFDLKRFILYNISSFFFFCNVYFHFFVRNELIMLSRERFSILFSLLQKETPKHLFVGEAEFLLADLNQKLDHTFESDSRRAFAYLRARTERGEWKEHILMMRQKFFFPAFHFRRQLFGIKLVIFLSNSSNFFFSSAGKDPDFSRLLFN